MTTRYEAGGRSGLMLLGVLVLAAAVVLYLMAEISLLWAVVIGVVGLVLMMASRARTTTTTTRYPGDTPRRPPDDTPPPM